MWLVSSSPVRGRCVVFLIKRLYSPLVFTYKTNKWVLLGAIGGWNISTSGPVSANVSILKWQAFDVFMYQTIHFTSLQLLIT